MAYIQAFGAYLPERVFTNQEIAARVGVDADWILRASGIAERRFAADGEEVEDLAVGAAQDCLTRAGVTAESIGMLIVASGSAARRFPGPAASVGARLGLGGAPCLDLPMASAGSLFGLAVAHGLAPSFGSVLLVGAEKMSAVAMREPLDRNSAILFGDGAGACLVGAESGRAEILGVCLQSDGSFAGDLCLQWDAPLRMNGPVVILQASRKIPAAIQEVCRRGGIAPASVDSFVMHQANLNLIVRVAGALSVPAERFFSNIRRYGNTSSASMLIAGCEWQEAGGFRPGAPVVFAGFGAGFHWGAVLALGTH
jgi:3-oxoacyl-[acyl-carrier-protein] synthase-3